MAGATPSPVVKHTSTTPKSSYSRNSSCTASTNAKRHCKLLLYLTRTVRIIIFFFKVSFEGDSNSDLNESSNMSGMFYLFVYRFINSSTIFIFRYPITTNAKRNKISRKSFK
jgi:hypothetical protein